MFDEDFDATALNTATSMPKSCTSGSIIDLSKNKKSSSTSNNDSNSATTNSDNGKWKRKSLPAASVDPTEYMQVRIT